jgi:hypothetical protein
VYDPSTPVRAAGAGPGPGTREDLVSNTTGGAGALAVLSAGAAALARAADLDTALGIILEAGTAAVGAAA